jgi:hypothetical protein
MRPSISTVNQAFVRENNLSRFKKGSWFKGGETGNYHRRKLTRREVWIWILDCPFCEETNLVKMKRKICGEFLVIFTHNIQFYKFMITHFYFRSHPLFPKTTFVNAGELVGWAVPFRHIAHLPLLFSNKTHLAGERHPKSTITNIHLWIFPSFNGHQIC